MRAEYTATGIDDYDNVPPTGAGATDYLIIDGYKKCRLYALPIRETDNGALKNPATLKPLGGTIYGATPSFNPAQFDGGAESN